MEDIKILFHLILPTILQTKEESSYQFVDEETKNGSHLISKLLNDKQN